MSRLSCAEDDIESDSPEKDGICAVRLEDDADLV